MRITRRSLAAGDIADVSTASVSAPAPPSAAPPAKRPRGRPSRSAPAAMSSPESLSSVPTPTNYDSGSDYVTPLSTVRSTPAPSGPSDSFQKPSTSKRILNRIEVHIPRTAREAAIESRQKLTKSKYAMKRKRPSYEDDEDEDLSDASPDAQVARRLQAEEDDEAAESPMARGAALRRSARGAASTVPTPPTTKSTKSKLKTVVNLLDDDDDEEDEDDDDYDDSVIKARPSAKFTQSRRPGRKVTKSDAIILDSDDDEEGDDGRKEATDGSDSDIFGIPTPRKRAQPRTRGAAGSRRISYASRRRGGPSGQLNRDSDVVSNASGDLVSSSDADFVSEDDESVNSDTDADEDGDARSQAHRRVARLQQQASDDQRSAQMRDIGNNRRAYRDRRSRKRIRKDRNRLEEHHPELKTMWTDLEAMPILNAGAAQQPASITRLLKPFQLQGLAWMIAMEKTERQGGLLGDEMGLGKTIQAVSLIMSDYPAKNPTLVLVPPVALMQWQSEMANYTDGNLKSLVYHGTNAKSKNLTVKDIKGYDVILMSYNSLESVYRKQEKGWKSKKQDGVYKEKSVIHQTTFHRVILDEAHSIKTRTTMTAKACFALQAKYRWCLTGTPLQNRIGEFFSLLRFLSVQPFSSYLCKQCSCTQTEWSMDPAGRCTHCNHGGMQHVSVFNQELLNPIQKFGNQGAGAAAFKKLRLLTDRIMLRRLKKDHTDSMELPVKEIYVDRQFFGEEENDFASSIMNNNQRKFDTYVASGVMLNNYANIFGLIMQMRQVADHPDLILKKNSEGGQNILVCCICDEPAEDAIRSNCKHDFCRSCARSYVNVAEQPDCPQCHVKLSIDLEQVEIEQDEAQVKKSSIINRIKMENWTSSSKIELLVHELHKLRSDNASHKSIIFSQFTTMLQLIEWRLRRAGITTVMLDGSMTPAQRQASIEHFMNNVDVECFLVSLKAGGVALNLTEASRVFIIDPWWNPAAEWQSADRCHRIGQTRPCTITRLCIEDSVESRMVLLQEKKTSMIHHTINADDTAMDSLSPEDLQFLFRGT